MNSLIIFSSVRQKCTKGRLAMYVGIFTLYLIVCDSVLLAVVNTLQEEFCK